jgi:hypothetical protein
MSRELAANKTLHEREAVMSHRAIAERYFSCVSKNDIEGALSAFAKEAEFVTPVGPVPFPEGVCAWLGGYATSFPGARVRGHQGRRSWRSGRRRRLLVRYAQRPDVAA